MTVGKIELGRRSLPEAIHVDGHCLELQRAHGTLLSAPLDGAPGLSGAAARPALAGHDSVLLEREKDEIEHEDWRFGVRLRTSLKRIV